MRTNFNGNNFRNECECIEYKYLVIVESDVIGKMKTMYLKRLKPI